MLRLQLSGCDANPTGTVNSSTAWAHVTLHRSWCILSRTVCIFHIDVSLSGSGSWSLTLWKNVFQHLLKYFILQLKFWRLFILMSKYISLGVLNSAGNQLKRLNNLEIRSYGILRFLLVDVNRLMLFWWSKLFPWLCHAVKNQLHPELPFLLATGWLLLAPGTTGPLVYGQ